jgi:hypothetical protein
MFGIHVISVFMVGKAGGADLDLALAVIGRTTQGSLVIDISAIPAQSNVLHAFQCHEIDPDGYLIPSLIVLTATHFLKLRERVDHPTQAVVLARRPVAKILKITAKKKHPNVLSIGFDPDEKEAAELRAASTTRKAEATDSNASTAPPPQDADCLLERYLIPQYNEAKAALCKLIDPAQ